MARQIKFRVWTGSAIEYNVMVGKFGAFYVNPGKKRDGLDENDSACLTPFNTKYPDQTPVMQFTGLKDKNGAEIYEGDIVRADTEDGIAVAEIVFHDEAEDEAIWLSGFSAKIRHYEDEYDESVAGFEVIGNIYENPELLED